MASNMKSFYTKYLNEDTVQSIELDGFEDLMYHTEDQLEFEIDIHQWYERTATHVL